MFSNFSYYLGQLENWLSVKCRHRALFIYCFMVFFFCIIGFHFVLFLGSCRQVLYICFMNVLYKSVGKLGFLHVNVDTALFFIHCFIFFGVISFHFVLYIGYLRHILLTNHVLLKMYLFVFPNLQSLILSQPNIGHILPQSQ
jgi:hypothetical protein